MLALPCPAACGDWVNDYLCKGSPNLPNLCSGSSAWLSQGKGGDTMIVDAMGTELSEAAMNQGASCFVVSDYLGNQDLRPFEAVMRAPILSELCSGNYTNEVVVFGDYAIESALEKDHPGLTPCRDRVTTGDYQFTKSAAALFSGSKGLIRWRYIGESGTAKKVSFFGGLNYNGHYLECKMPNAWLKEILLLGRAVKVKFHPRDDTAFAVVYGTVVYTLVFRVFFPLCYVLPVVGVLWSRYKSGLLIAHRLKRSTRVIVTILVITNGALAFYFIMGAFFSSGDFWPVQVQTAGQTLLTGPALACCAFLANNWNNFFAKNANLIMSSPTTAASSNGIEREKLQLKSEPALKKKRFKYFWMVPAFFGMIDILVGVAGTLGFIKVSRLGNSRQITMCVYLVLSAYLAWFFSTSSRKLRKLLQRSVKLGTSMNSLVAAACSRIKHLGEALIASVIAMMLLVAARASTAIMTFPFVWTTVWTIAILSRAALSFFILATVLPHKKLNSRKSTSSRTTASSKTQKRTASPSIAPFSAPSSANSHN